MGLPHLSTAEFRFKGLWEDMTKNKHGIDDGFPDDGAFPKPKLEMEDAERFLNVFEKEIGKLSRYQPMRQVAPSGLLAASVSSWMMGADSTTNSVEKASEVPNLAPK